MVLSSKTQGLNLSVPCSIKALPFCRFPLCNCVVCVWFFSRRGSRVAPEIPESRWVKGLWNLVLSSSHNRDSRECFGIWNPRLLWIYQLTKRPFSLRDVKLEGLRPFQGAFTLTWKVALNYVRLYRIVLSLLATFDYLPVLYWYLFSGTKRTNCKYTTDTRL